MFLQVGKAYFELVDYYEADRAFSLSRRASPYTLEGMDIYSTVLYVSSSCLCVCCIISLYLIVIFISSENVLEI